MLYVGFDVAEDYGSTSRTLEAVIAVESDRSKAELLSLVDRAINGDGSAAKEILSETKTYIAYTKDGTEWLVWDNNNLVSRPKGGTATNRKFTRTKCKSYPKDDGNYRLSWLLNLAKFLKVSVNYEDLEPEDRLYVQYAIEAVKDFTADPTIESVKNMQRRFHELARN